MLGNKRKGKYGFRFRYHHTGFVMSKNRLKYIDAAKGLAMMCIILGHLGNTLIMRLVFTFHVPVFLIISGYFYNADREKLSKRSIKYLKVYGVTVLFVIIFALIKQMIMNWIGRSDENNYIQIILKWVFAGLYGSGSKVDFLGINVVPIGAIWFILALVWSEWALKGIIVLSKKTQENIQWIVRWGITGVLFSAAVISAKYIWLPFSIQAGLAALLFILISYEIKNHKQKTESPYLLYICLLCALIWGVSIYFSMSNDYMSIVRCSFPNIIINILGSISATWLIIYFLKTIEKKKWLVKCFDLLSLFGKNSLIVLSFHLIELNTFPWKDIMKIVGLVGGSALIATFILKMIWCIIGIYCVRKISFFSRIYS